MKQFAQLIKTLDATNKTNDKVAVLANYFKVASDKDKVWTIAILSHRRPSRPVNTTLLRAWAAQAANIPLWLFEETYHIVGDLAETIALVVPHHPKNEKINTLASFLEAMIWLKKQDETQKRKYVLKQWQILDYYQRFVFTKLITGGFRIGVSQKLMTRALHKATGIAEDELAYKLMGNWDPTSISYHDLVLTKNTAHLISKPYPFYLAYPVEGAPASLGPVNNYSIEHKWDGIRAQIIIRNNQLFIWSRGEELVTPMYPEFSCFINNIPNGTVIDGELLVVKEGVIQSFNALQQRLGRKSISKKLIEKAPAAIMAYDLLEWQGQDIRQLSFIKRRSLLEALFKNNNNLNLPLYLSTVYQFSSWDAVAKEREKSREKHSEGLMIKRLEAPYQVGRKKGDWWKWKVDPHTIDGVLTYAMRGHGRRTNLFTDYTFALWNDTKTELVTFAKAYSGLTDTEFKKVDAWIKKNTLERFGPVRSVTPYHVFEIAFEGVSLSKRHKSGVATRFPRIVKWRTDKKIEEANTINDLKSLIV